MFEHTNDLKDYAADLEKEGVISMATKYHMERVSRSKDNMSVWYL
jgi:hypothetical protein